jgi:hypothetical protein
MIAKLAVLYGVWTGYKPRQWKHGIGTTSIYAKYPKHTIDLPRLPMEKSRST